MNAIGKTKPSGAMVELILKGFFIFMVCSVSGINQAYGQGFVFSSGSDESRGDMTITEDITLELPADGIFHFGSFTVNEEATLTFNRNVLNTPVYILATGPISIQGTINISGTRGNMTPPLRGFGGPGGFDGGEPGTLDAEPGDGFGPGGGKSGPESGVGSGAYGSLPNHNRTTNGQIYGSPLLVPLIGGSGGGGSSGQPGIGGAGGGGAILISSDTRVDISGQIVAAGGSNGGDQPTTAQGSGGAIRIVSPNVSVTGSLNVQGGQTGAFGEPEIGGFGRVRIDTLDPVGVSNLNIVPSAALTSGRLLSVFPDSRRLDIIEAAGQSIDVGTRDEVIVILDAADSPNQTVVVQATDFRGMVPVEVVLTPEHGSSTVFTGTIDMASGNPATTSVDVVIPVNIPTRVHAWKR